MMVDDRQAAASAVLKRAAYPQLRSLSCELRQGRLVVAGHVPSFYLKQLAQTLLLGHFGDQMSVENCVDVSDDATRGRLALSQKVTNDL